MLSLSYLCTGNSQFVRPKFSLLIKIIEQILSRLQELKKKLYSVSLIP